jgi:hypothetical protein
MQREFLLSILDKGISNPYVRDSVLLRLVTDRELPINETLAEGVSAWNSNEHWHDTRAGGREALETEASNADDPLTASGATSKKTREREERRSKEELDETGSTRDDDER